MNELIATHGAIMDRYDPEKKIALVVDEWGAWLVPTPGSKEGFLEQQNSMRDAIIAALNINIFARHADRVRMANIAQMINVLQAMILTDRERLVLTPTYHVFHMYVPFQDATLLPVSFDAGAFTHGEIRLPQLDANAAKGRDGKVWLAITNIDPTSAAELDLSTRAKRATGKLLSAAKVDSVNTFDAPTVIAPKPLEARASGGRIRLKLPPHSIAVVALEQ